MAGTTQSVPNVARVEMRYSTSLQPLMENIYYVQADTPISGDMLTSLAGAFDNWESTHASLLRNDGIALYSIVLTDLTSLNSIRLSIAVEPAIGGANGSAKLPNNATWAIKADIGKRGRGRAGRTFWIGLSGEQTTEDELSEAAAASIITALEELRTAVAAVEGWQGLVIPHFIVDKARPPVVAVDAVLHWVATDLFIDSQRDRLPFHKKKSKKKVVGPTPG